MSLDSISYICYTFLGIIIDVESITNVDVLYLSFFVFQSNFSASIYKILYISLVLEQENHTISSWG